MSGRVFVIADPHFGHLKAANLRGFPTAEAHDAALVDGWSRVVGKRDVVYVLGDIFRLDPLRALPGVKKLAMGNHDRSPVSEYAAVFSKVGACFEYDGCLLTHVPVHPSQFARWELNVHGHVHARPLGGRYVSACVESVGYAPVLLSSLIYTRRMNLRKSEILLDDPI